MWQRGFATVAVAAGIAVLAAGAYHFAVTSGLKSTIEDKNKEIAKINKEKVSLELRNAALDHENKEFAKATAEQNKAVQDIKKERDFNKGEWEKAKKVAVAAKATATVRIKEILATKLASVKEACGVWEKLITDYVAERQKARVPR